VLDRFVFLESIIADPERIRFWVDTNGELDHLSIMLSPFKFNPT
jgi:hypothetical protein